MIVFDVQISNLDALQQSFAQAPEITTKAVTDAINASLIGYQGGIKQNAPIDTGRYRASISITPAQRMGNRIEGSVGPQVNYAEAIETGTGIYGPHRRPITPKRAKALMFTVNGRKVFAKSVKGMRARHPVERALHSGQSRTDRYFANAAELIARQLGGAR